MSEPFHIQPEDRPRLDSKYLLRWEKSQDAYVLLYPEGVIKLNTTAAEILKRCTGETTVANITSDLKALFLNNTDIESSIYKFLEITHGKGWIRS